MHQMLLDKETAGHKTGPNSQRTKSRDRIAREMDKRLDAMRRDMLQGRNVDMLAYEDLLRARGDLIVHLAPPRPFT